MSASIGGGYAALMGGKKAKGASKPAGGDGGAPHKAKAAKVISLKDTHEKKPPPQGTKGQHAELKKTEEPPKKAPVRHEEKDLTRREVKQERAATDRHVPRSGVADHHKEKKNEQVAEALDAAAEKPSDAYAEKRREYEERDAERRRREEEEKRKVSYADYQKSLAEKKNELAELQKAHERKVDTKKFATMTEMKKDAKHEFLRLEKDHPEAASKPAAKKGGKQDKAAAKAKPAEAAAPPKKNKFHKTTDIQLGFFSKPTQPRPPRGPRRDFENQAQKPEAKAEEPAAAEAAPAAETAEPAAEPAAAAVAEDGW